MLSLQEREVKAVEWNTPSKFLKSIQQSEKKVISTQWLLLQFIAKFTKLAQLKTYLSQHSHSLNFYRYPIIPSYYISHTNKRANFKEQSKENSETDQIAEIYPGDEEYDDDLFAKFTKDDPEVKQFKAKAGMHNRIYYMHEDLKTLDRGEFMTEFEHPLFRMLNTKVTIFPKL